MTQRAPGRSGGSAARRPAAVRPAGLVAVPTARRPTAPKAGAPRGSGRRRIGLATAVPASCTALAVAVPAFWGGGFGPAAQAVFVALAGAALFAVVVVDAPSVIAAVRTPLVVALIGLAGVSVASSAWTIAGAGVALRTGLVAVGYAATAIAGRSLGRQVGARYLAVAVAVFAVVEALLGLGAVALHALPDAERLGREWRPGGTFEYQPALGLLQVGGLPILAMALRRPGRRAAAVAGTSAVIAGGVLGLDSDRLALGLAALVLLGIVAHPRSDRPARIGAITVAALALAGGMIAPRVLGGAVGPHAPAAGLARLAAFIVIALLAGVALPVARTLRRRSISAVATAGVVVVVALAIAVGVVGRYVPAAASRPSVPRQGAVVTVHRPAPTDVLHGRTHEWQAAVATWRDRPVIGAGAGSYYLASLPHQAIARSLFAHNLPLEWAAELGIVGFGLALALYTGAGRLLWRARRDHGAWLLVPFVAAFLVSNLVDWTWHLAGLTALWAVACGGLMSSPGRTQPGAITGTDSSGAALGRTASVPGGASSNRGPRAARPARAARRAR